MNAEQVVQKILSEARTKAEKIINEAKTKAAEQTSELERELSDFDAQTEQLAKAAGEDKLQRMLASARMDNAKQSLAAKVEILDQVFERSVKAVNDLPDEAYLSWITKMLKQAVQSGDEEVIVGKPEKRIDEKFISRLNQQLGDGFKGNLRLSPQRADISGGFILSRGSIRINAATDVLIEALRESMQIELANELFS